MRRVAALTLLAAAATLLLPSVAQATTAAPVGEVVAVDQVPATGGLSLVFQANGLPDGQRIDPRSVRVSSGGARLAATAAPIRLGTDVTRTAVLAVDTSRSMGSGQLQIARSAATTFVTGGGLPRDVKVGLVTFDTGTRVVVAPTRDRARLLAAIDGLTLASDKGTALYDGAAKAVALAGQGGARSVLLLTDGQEFKSSALTRAEAVTAIADAEVSLDAVYIGDEEQPEDLSALVSGVDGRVFSATDEDLRRIYRDAARAIRNQVTITIPVPADLAGQSVTLDVQARAGGSPLSSRVQGTFGAFVGDVSPRPVELGWAARIGGTAVLPLGFLALFLGLGTLVALALTRSGSRGSAQSRLRRRLSLYTLTGRQTTPPEPPASSVLGRSLVARSAIDLAGRVVQQRAVEAALGTRLEAAGLPLRPAEWALIHLGCALGLGLFLLLISGAAVVPALLGLFLGAVLPWLYLSLAESRRTSAFMGQLPETLQLISGSLSAGYSLPQALDTVVREGQQPMTAEFNRALVETRLGVPIEDALNGVADRMDSKDFAWVVMAYRIQRDVGGNLAELLATLAETMRERDALRRQVKALSAEGRLSGWILGLLPPVFTLYLLATRPEYLRPLVTEPLGLLMVSVGAGLLVIGALWMAKAVKVEV